MHVKIQQKDACFVALMEAQNEGLPAAELRGIARSDENAKQSFEELDPTEIKRSTKRCSIVTILIKPFGFPKRCSFTLGQLGLQHNSVQGGAG
jgi:hypothetical protein